MVRQYAPTQFISNYDELCNLVVFIVAWKCEQLFTKDFAWKETLVDIGSHGKTKWQTVYFFPVPNIVETAMEAFPLLVIYLFS